MVKVSNIIDEVIADTMKKYNQEMQTTDQYKTLFENLINGNYRDKDINRLIKQIKLTNLVVKDEIIEIIRKGEENERGGNLNGY